MIIQTVEEKWRDVVGFEGYYQVSNLGRVMSMERIDCHGQHRHEKIMKLMTDDWGYYYVILYKGAKGKKYRIHRLVASAFVPNPDILKFDQVNHKDENKKNNSPNNLEWCDAHYNANYGTRTKRAALAVSGEGAWTHKLTSKDVYIIRKVYVPGSPLFGGAALAKKYGVSTSAIQRAIHKKTWKHLEKEEPNDSRRN